MTVREKTISKYLVEGDKKGRGGFGVGILEDEDEDVYSGPSRARYTDLVMEEDEDKIVFSTKKVVDPPKTKVFLILMSVVWKCRK